LEVDGFETCSYIPKYVDQHYLELTMDTHFEPTMHPALPQPPPPDVHNTPAPLAAIGEQEMPTAAHFRREHFPALAIDPADWRLRIGGSVATPAIVTLADLRRMPRRSLVVVLECAGHRRAELEPATPGLQWGAGAVSEARWSGTPLRDLLWAAGIDRDADEVVLTGADRGAFERQAGQHPYARSLPLRKALHRDTILAYEMNGGPIPPEHGGPVRAIVPGWYATDSVKWVERIHVAKGEFDGPFQAVDYRFATADDPGPGTRMERMPVQALITHPAGGATLAPGRVRIRGAAWSGAGAIARVQVRVDEGPWKPAAVVGRTGRYGRTLWECGWDAEPGRHTIAVRAVDASGAVQPDKSIWNRRGYAVNAVHRVAVTVGAVA
jgi:DMSO/TMAO reductase YedYZ molybdopterin-dependent catalytic subunit